MEVTAGHQVQGRGSCSFLKEARTPGSKHTHRHTLTHTDTRSRPRTGVGTVLEKTQKTHGLYPISVPVAEITRDLPTFLLLGKLSGFLTNQLGLGNFTIALSEASFSHTLPRPTHWVLNQSISPGRYINSFHSLSTPQNRGQWLVFQITLIPETPTQAHHQNVTPGSEGMPGAHSKTRGGSHHLS